MNRFALAALAALTLSAPAFAGDYRAGGIEVRRPWTRPAQAGMNGVGYLTVANVGAKPVKLVAVETPAAFATSFSVTLRDAVSLNESRLVMNAARSHELAPTNETPQP